ncbi:Beta-ketoacyl synthase, N-terminal domain protein [Lautropia mirabilis ATCC 51599]|uniref:Beta-ketoacyl synthase, N-terminal domain protein n=1 Tax=Lautropia mirabilis ATCC 51599 TaxID=887898 RepID=E7S0S1_9BURK|nr:Beta-ketoacyl synthase, N-terminal domain protein [Lautropia mirabilis ATCC 51599]
MLKRVVVTGVGGISPLGRDWPTIQARLASYRNAVRYMPEWDRYPDLNTRLGAPVTDFETPAHWTRKQLRSLGRVSRLCVAAAEDALSDAGLLDDPSIRDGRMGVACGSSTGSTADVSDMAKLLIDGVSPGFNANTYVRMMPHTTAANIAIFFGLTGRVIPTSCACASGSQGIGYAYESIKYGMIDMMLAGGGEELCPSEAYVFDSLYATSLKNDRPEASPSPYDSGRDGLVIGEGAGILVLESLEHARARGARIYAEVAGYASNCDGSHVTRPEQATMHACMQAALRDAGIAPSAVGYVNGHGTATEHGDIAETLATEALFGDAMPLSSLKSYMGHTLGACGALESWFSIEMMRQQWFAPTLNLVDVDPRCGQLDYIRGEARHIDTEYVVNNNFAFGGLNTSLVFRRLD